MQMPSFFFSPVPPQILALLWEMYGSTLIDCHYDHDAISQVWDSFGSILSESCPLRLPECLAYAPGEDADAVGAPLTAHDAATVGLLIFELPWTLLDDAQRQSISDVPLTVLPMLEFLRAVVAWRVAADCAATTTSGPREGVVDATKTRLQLVVRHSGTGSSSYDALGAHSINKLLAVQGTVIRLSSPKVVCKMMQFRCNLCGSIKNVELEGGPLQYPPACNGKCRGFFQPLTEGAVTEEVQLLKLQESTNAVSSGSSTQGIARVVEIELRGVWMDIAAAGDNVSIVGIVSTRRGDKAAGGLRQLSLKALSLTSLGSHGSSALSSRGRGGDHAASYGYGKVAQFYELVRHPRWMDRLVDSLCPGIMGHQDVKAAMLLALVGGSAKSHVRSNVHLLLIGDPGLGKSQMLRAVAAAAPRSSMATANTSSSCGLTITLSRDPQNGETTFEAGAVVHGDGGVTCIDEIDKGASEHKALLEVMEQCSISIAKAGTLFSMPVETSIIAAGNPVGGKFQPMKSLSENLNLSAPLLSRFDVIFLLQSHTSSASQSITSHVLSMHRTRNHGSNAQDSATLGGAGGMIPTSLITEFVQFAKDTCRPVMTTAAAIVLRDAYIEARKQFATNNTQLPVTPRYLQSLVRMSEAKAKLDLRSEVTSDDAMFAVTLLKRGTKSYMEGGPAGGVPSAHPGGGSKKLSPRDAALANIERLMASNGTDSLTHDEAVGCCADAGCKNPNAMLHQLNDHGALLMSGGRYRLRKKL
ncbi:minichromosomal maintenance complex subunit, putative [Bodo saltans]|uniref:Minichromosomal maintenance complex subunit, putative n=1 Tax=Bodo saltans TaxID=75058 RepID=A0A0S4J5X8_BODSA|nr:minichromosomal maintenance complex subunit, putative [Bodo saltans]|eukprot:CUG84640.1 minichromosomal maintenance complex subunit, putative [Bodo saltans]